MSANLFPTRPTYADRQFLQAADLRADQDYHRHMRWRHNLALHSWGVVAGLAVTLPTDGGDRVRVETGMAIDGFGRELVLAQPGEEAGQQRLDRGQAYDVWLEYALDDKAGPNRLKERPWVRVRPTVDRPSADPAVPPGVPTADLEFGADRPPPADDRPWPVFLARLDFQEGGWVPDTRGRRYAGLVADRVVSPDGSAATVLLTGIDPDRDDYRFAVSVAGADWEKNPPFLAVREPSGGPTIDLRAARVMVAGDLVMHKGSAVEFQANSPAATAAHAGELAGAGHWRMYHHFSTPTPTPADPNPTGFSDELRVTMPAAPAGGGRVVFGSFGEQGKFVPVLAVKDDKSVEVYGTLRVKGRVSATQTDADDTTPAGGGGAAPDPIAALRVVESALRNSSLSWKTVLDQLTPVAGFAVAVADRSSPVPENVADAMWKSTSRLPREALGTKATTVDTEFRDFLNKLPGTQPVKSFTTWALESAQAVSFADSFPDTQADVQDFANQLAKDDERYTALVQALLDARPAGNFQIAGRALTDVKKDIRALLEGIGDETPNDPLIGLAVELFDHSWVKLGTAEPAKPHGKEALADALGVLRGGLPKHPAAITASAVGMTPASILADARLRMFFDYVKTQASPNGTDRQKEFEQLRLAIMALAATL